MDFQCLRGFSSIVKGISGLRISTTCWYIHTAVYPPAKRFQDPDGYPVDVTVCPGSGTAYVADLYDTSNGGQSSIQVYENGSTTPTGTLNYPNDFRNPYLTCGMQPATCSLHFSTGEYVGDGRVVEFPLGKQSGAERSLGITVQANGGIKPDNAGNLLVNDLVAEIMITEYTEDGSPTGQSIATGTQVEGIAVSENGRIVLGASQNISGPYGASWSFPGGKPLQLYTCCSRIGPPLQVNYDDAFYPGQKASDTIGAVAQLRGRTSDYLLAVRGARGATYRYSVVAAELR